MPSILSTLSALLWASCSPTLVFGEERWEELLMNVFISNLGPWRSNCGSKVFFNDGSGKSFYWIPFSGSESSLFFLGRKLLKSPITFPYNDAFLVGVFALHGAVTCRIAFPSWCSRKRTLHGLLLELFLSLFFLLDSEEPPLIAPYGLPNHPPLEDKIFLL